MKKNILVTGKPGCGKTTLVGKVAAALGNRAGGFISREIREGNRRVGFSLHTLDGQEGILARAGLRSPHRVGRYGVHLKDVESVAVPSVRDAVKAGRIVVIDEIARMELFSRAFKEAVIEALDAPVQVVASIQIRRDAFLDGIRKREDVTLLTLTEENRDRLSEDLIRSLLREE